MNTELKKKVTLEAETLGTLHVQVKDRVKKRLASTRSLAIQS